MTDPSLEILISEIFQGLAAEFDPEDEETVDDDGRTFTYVKAPSVIDRLNAVLGPENWEDDYSPVLNGLKCRLTITLPSGQKIVRCGGGAPAGMRKADFDVKSAFTSAFRHAAMKFGVGRYLYARHSYAVGEPDRQEQAPRDTAPRGGGSQDRGRDNRPDRGQDRQEQAPRGRQDNRQDRGRAGGGGGYQNNRSGGGGVRSGGGGQDRGPDPKNGRQLFAWAKKQEEQFSINLIDQLTQFAKNEGIPGRMTDWGTDDTRVVYLEAVEIVRDANR